MTRGRENRACSITETGKRADSVRMLPSHHSSASLPGPEAAGKSEAEEVWRGSCGASGYTSHPRGRLRLNPASLGTLLSSFVSGNDVQPDEAPINSSRPGPRVCWRKPASIRT